MDADFERVYLRNVAAAHYVYGVIAQGLQREFPQGRVCVKSNVLGFLKSVRTFPGYSPEAVRPEQLAAVWYLEPSRFLLDSIDEWRASSAPRLKGFDIGSVFNWENYLGSWQAASQHEWDIVLDSLDLFNCRSLMGRLLGLPPDLRCKPDNIFHRTAMQAMWPEVLQAPLNPAKP